MARLILSLDNQVLAEYNLNRERYTVGRLPDNDIRIDHPTVSGHHSVLVNILNDSFLEDLNSTNGTYVNGRLVRKHALQAGDVITVGRHQLRYLDSGAADEPDEFTSTMVLDRDGDGNAVAAAVPARLGIVGSQPAAANEAASSTAPRPLAVARLQVLTGKFTGREVVLAKALTTLGRAGSLVVAITRRGDGYHAVTLHLADGEPAPRINGELLGLAARRLADHDIVEIAGVKMGFFLA
jgi:pSer/pThr/pTyr-binding forkhead associated (FHA) protein